MFPWFPVLPLKKNGIRTDPDAALGLTVSVARPATFLSSKAKSERHHHSEVLAKVISEIHAAPALKRRAA
jgi:hypothetical protein